MSAEQFEQIARQAAQLARMADEVNTHLRRLGEAAVSVIGGTATGADRVMLGLAQQATAKTRLATSSFTEAARTARNAAITQRQRGRGESDRNH